MHDDLRRRALESGKTVSNKAKSKPTSRGSSKANSATNSRAASRIQSRDASDDEDPGNGNLSDDTNLSINSIDQFLESDEFNEKYSEKSFDILRSELQTVIGSLVDRKGTSSSSREAFLTNYIRTLTSHYMAEGLYGHVSEVLAAFSASVKAEATEQEAKLALRAIALTAISYEDDNIYDTVSAVLKRSISDSESLPIKAAAIYSLGICISFGGAAEEEILDVLTFLLEIVSSDGSFIGALDNAEVVAAALHTYGFLATQVEDIEHESEDAISAFLEQLDSDDVRVQVAAGENIALLYEKSYTPREHDDTPSENEDEDSSDDEFDGPRDNSDLVKRYNAYHNTAEVLEKVNALAGISTKSINRRDKRALHSSFTTIAHTIDKPKNGLKTSNASKMVVRIHNEGEMRVDKWWKFMRLNAIRRLLAFGFVNHYFEGNKQVLDALPMIMRATGGSGIASPRKGGSSKATKGKYRDSRRFVSGGDFDEST